MSTINVTRAKTAVQFSNDDDIWNDDSSIRPLGWRVQKRSPKWRPPTDVFEREDAYLIVVEVAGMRGTEISVTLEKGILTILGLRTNKSERKAYHQMEIAYGEFETKVRLPKRTSTDKIEASYSDGFLRVILPKQIKKEIPIEG
jgi:HSP20 family molecular chaperone IbpA